MSAAVSSGAAGAVADRDLPPLRVAEVRTVAEDVVVLDLVDPSGAELPPWEAGAHLELVLPSGLIRQYSLCGRGEDRHRYSVAVLRVADGRGGSKEIHDTDLVGTELEVRGPRNNFPLIDAPAYLLLAGGIGVTPLLAMARELQATGRQWSMVYGGRTLDKMAFRDELLEVGAARLTLVPEDTAGFPDLPGLLGGAATGTAVYCCGPEGMLDAVESVHADLNGAISLHIERFSASAETLEKINAAGTAFEVELRRSGRVLDVAADQSLLEAVRTVVPGIEFSCSEGICGTCETRVLDGDIDHRDGLLTDDERDAGDTMMICVSRCRSPRLVLDL